MALRWISRALASTPGHVDGSLSESGISLRRMVGPLRYANRTGIKVPRFGNQIAGIKVPRMKLGNDDGAHENGINVGEVLLSVTKTGLTCKEFDDGHAQVVQIDGACHTQVR